MPCNIDPRAQIAAEKGGSRPGSAGAAAPAPAARRRGPPPPEPPKKGGDSYLADYDLPSSESESDEEIDRRWEILQNVVFGLPAIGGRLLFAGGACAAVVLCLCSCCPGELRAAKEWARCGAPSV